MSVKFHSWLVEACEALDIDPLTTRRIEIVLTPDALPVVTVQRWAPDDSAPFTTWLERATLVPKAYTP